MSGSSIASLADLDTQLLLSTPRYALRRHLHQAAISKGSIAYQDPITFDIIHTDVYLTEHPDLCRHVGERHCPHYTEEEILKPTVAARAGLQQHDARGGAASPSPHSSDDISDDESSCLGSSSSSSSSGSSTSSSSSSSYASEVSATTSTQNNKNASAIKKREISQAVASSTLTISNKGNQERKVPSSANTKPDNSNKTAAAATRLWKASPFQRPHGVPFVANDLQKLKSASNNGAKAAPEAAPTAAAHMVVDIEELRAMPKYRQYSTMHKLAVDSGHDCYRDVATGCLVFCRPFLAQQACCGEDCRHCPYGRHKGRSQLELRRGGDRAGRTPVIGDTRGGASGSTRGGRGVARHYSSSSSSSSDNSSDDEDQ